jgi:hypothetical protein
VSIQNAREFLDYVGKNPELADKLKGFTIDELRQAVGELELSTANDDIKSNKAIPILPI